VGAAARRRSAKKAEDGIQSHVHVEVNPEQDESRKSDDGSADEEGAGVGHR